VPAGARQALATRLSHDIAGFGPIQPLIDDPSVAEIMVNRYDDIWTERAGLLQPEPAITFAGEQQVRDLCERIALPLRRRIDESNPVLDGRLPDGSRVNAVLHPVSLAGTCLTIRKFMRALTVAKLQQVGTITPQLAAVLRSCVIARCSILVIGGTSSGKTALLNALSAFIPANERVVTIEDAAELMLQQPHVVRLETRPPNVEGRGEITVRDLVRNALRMRPDRIVVGECRGAEALDMMQAANTGHDGTFSTLHANSPADALSRLETMALMADSGLPAVAIRRQIASAFDLVIQVGRLKNGARRILEVAELTRLESGELATAELFRYDPATDQPVPAGRPSLRVAQRCAWAGVRLEGVTPAC
jgi:pilus assembly protein CpaF